MAHPRATSTAETNFVALKEFAELPDRDATPFFGGRADEIATVERALERIRRRTQEGHWQPAGGETVLFQGAPGAGKSALLHHFVKLWRSFGRNAPVVVATALTNYVNERTLALRVAEAVDPEIAARFRRSETTHSSSRIDASGGIPGVVSGSGSRNRYAKRQMHPPNCHSLPSRMRSRKRDDPSSCFLTKRRVLRDSLRKLCSRSFRSFTQEATAGLS